MYKYNEKFAQISALPAPSPDFSNLLKVLSRQKPSRPTLFELFFNPSLEDRLVGRKREGNSELERLKMRVAAFTKAGYDYATIYASEFFFRTGDVAKMHTRSANSGYIITDRESYENYVWNEPSDFYKGSIEAISPFVPEGMKLVVMSPGGVLENVTSLVGYDNLCYMLADDPDLVEVIFNEVGSRLLKYYEIIVDYPEVGAIISNDDWGFNTQTMLSVSDMRKYVFPQHQKIADLVHSKGKPIILHSCGQLSAVIDNIIYDMKYDAKHSYEDNINPVENAYEQYKGKIAVLGGIDLDFVCRRTPKEVYDRAVNMLNQTNSVGYALGSGNSIPAYVPVENYLSMIAAVIHNR